MSDRCNSLPNDAVELTWALLVPTLNRIDVLERSVGLALDQDPPPMQVIIVDGSENWSENKDIISTLFTDRASELVYIPAAERSITVQRNQALQKAKSDICFLFDDDTLMHSACAKEVLRIYQLDTAQQIAAVTPANVDAAPDTTDTLSQDIVQKEKSNSAVRSFVQNILPAAVRNFVENKILLFEVDERLVPYDPGGYRPFGTLPRKLAEQEVIPVRLISGFRITARRSVLQKEPFEPALLAYAPSEDLDVSYRLLRHGQSVLAPKARVHHFEAAASRIKRRKVAELSLLNQTIFIRKHAKQKTLVALKFYFLSLRFLLSALIRDAGGKRFSFPEVRGIFAAVFKSPSVFLYKGTSLDEWYKSIQRKILES